MFCSYSFVNFLCLTLSVFLTAAVFVFKARRAWTFGLCLFLINSMIQFVSSCISGCISERQRQREERGRERAVGWGRQEEETN